MGQKLLTVGGTTTFNCKGGEIQQVLPITVGRDKTTNFNSSDGPRQQYLAVM